VRHSGNVEVRVKTAAKVAVEVKTYEEEGK
jgi:hypothetical protein